MILPCSAIETLSQHRCFEGIEGYYRHISVACGGTMRFAVFEPPQARERPVPVLYYLAGLACTEETFMVKAGAQRVAAELGLMLVAPDTSPRDTRYPGDADSWDFGLGAGFYIDATQTPWRCAYRMESYVACELPALIAAHFPADPERQGIFGHSMGGHGALILALRHSGQYRSLSAFSPISAPSRCPWGEKAFSRYLGPDLSLWSEHDATALITHRSIGRPILIDQGLADPFLIEQLNPHLLEAACEKSGQALILRRHKGYDHGYFFVQTFIEDHLRFHYSQLMSSQG